MKDTMGSQHRADSQADLAHRRKSLPARSANASAHKHIPPASPEVISSLISSLSAISTPAQSHFDNFPEIGPRTAPSSPGFRQTEFPRDGWDANVPTTPGFGMDYGAYNKPVVDEEENSFLHPDDAAISPVVRMAKAPASPRSPRSPCSPRSPPGDTSPMRSGSRASMASSITGPEDGLGFGVPSLEPGPRMSTASIASSSSGGRRSLKHQLNILKRASREFPKDKDSDRFHKGGDGRLNSSRSRLSLRSTPSMADLAEEVSLNNGVFQLLEKQLNEDNRRESAPTLGTQRSIPDTGNGSPGGIGSGRVIPTRESSLRHSYHGNSNKKRRSGRHSVYSNRDFTIDRDIAEVNAEDDQVSKRIQELKEQQKKIKDELQTDGTPEGNPQSRTPRPSPKQPATQQTTVTKETVLVRQSVHTVSDQPLKEVDETQHESAPSPAILTRKSHVTQKRNSGPLSLKTTNIQPASGKQSFEKPDRNESGVLRRKSTQNSNSESNHRRTLSGAVSPGPRLSLGQEDRPSSSDSIDDAVHDYLSSRRLTQKVRHPHTGRVIAFSEVGDPKGHVVFCCVGMGLTRYLTAFYDELARTLKLRLITPDRPGVGESEPCVDGSGTPLSWPDDVAIICNFLKITKFSMMAHSAGAIYALATALRMPQHIRGRLHLLAPWIPPSQMTSMGSHKEPLPASAVPYSQRILRALPTPFLKVANSSFMTTTSASITSSLPKNSRRTKRRSTTIAGTSDAGFNNFISQQRRSSVSMPRGPTKRDSQEVVSRVTANPSDPKAESAIIAAAAAIDKERQSDYDNRLTHAIWELATTNANPAVDLLVCLERRQTIGFRYVDINRAVVIHHGTRDTRVPVDNVRWLGKTMRRCEVRVLEGEGHGLMASALVMGNVMMEVAKEWEDWTTVVQGRREGGRRGTVTNRH
ncbi:hypothetical protein RJZ56_002470 [Blastomyces dermatitidis]|uniref:Hydrolase n=2 Tax=Blastomyces TaxID=229219 RepID=A0A179UIL3_BLAGS|nr:hydrolase [Blastomyces gilchristii SLH14081]EGE79657.1 hydrolase [Blastomyces dermatitidis ATCC 18188]EQL34202.1 hypothetical protein BDFG_03871 [Blastomyces dermatitidis ATCC 26199]OAT07906.1 hydrolase [Blastomyces gilchristii SLH14081]